MNVDRKLDESTKEDDKKEVSQHLIINEFDDERKC